jgi:hypothetical protein
VNVLTPEQERDWAYLEADLRLLRLRLERWQEAWRAWEPFKEMLNVPPEQWETCNQAYTTEQEHGRLFLELRAHIVRSLENMRAR